VTTCDGVPAGAAKASHASSAKPLGIASCKVGTSGITLERLALVTASARKVPCCAGRKAVGMVGKPTSICLLSNASTMSGAPL